MGRKSIQLSSKCSILDGVLRFMYTVLTTRYDSDSQMNNSIDFNLLYWTVIFISELLDGFNQGPQQKLDKGKTFSMIHRTVL